MINKSYLIALVLFVLAGCSATSNNTTESEGNRRIPKLVIKFEEGKSSFNNYVLLQKKIEEYQGVMVSINTNRESINLADKRVQEIINSMPDGKFVYTTFRYTNNVAEHNYVEVFGLKTKQEFEPLLKTINSSSLVRGLGRLYTEDDVRQWRFEVDEKSIDLKGEGAAVEQLSSLLKLTGWKLVDCPALLDSEGNLRGAIPLNMKVILVNGVMASMEEVKSLIETWLDVYEPSNNYVVDIDKSENKVVIKS